MRRLTIRVLVACAMGAAGWHVAAAPAALPAIASTQAAVTVKVTPRILDGAVWEFDVVMDTHAQDLGDDLLKAAKLVAADGSEVAPLEWKGSAPGGHHRAGVLRFQAPKPAPAAVVLRITRPGEPKPRVFEWKAG
jgi:hypothetical protein